MVRDKEAQQYIEQVDEEGNVYLVEAFDPDNEDEEGEGEEEDEDGEGQYIFHDGGDDDYDDQDMEGIVGNQMIDGGDLEDDEFLEMMEQQALHHKLRYGNQH